MSDDAQSHDEFATLLDDDDDQLVGSDGRNGVDGYLEIEGVNGSDDMRPDSTDGDVVESGGAVTRPWDEGDGQQAEAYCNAMLEDIGIGRYQLFVLLMCGLANAADAVELMSISFVLSSTAQCDLFLTDERKGVLTAAVFMGMIPGGLTFGLLADKYGRRMWLGTGLVLNAVGTLASSQAGSFAAFVGWRVLSGFGVGGSIPILFSFILEFVPGWARGKMLIVVAFFWVVGTVICASLAWGILAPGECPTQADWLDMSNSTLGEGDDSLPEYCHAIEQMECSRLYGKPSWRTFMASCCAPAAATALMLLVADESPKWLVEGNHRDRARVVLTKMARLNGKVINIATPPRVHRRGGRGVDTAGAGGLVALAAVHLQPITKTLKAPHRTQFLWLGGVWFFLCFGFYGFRLWMTDFFAEGGVSDDTNIYAASFYVALANIPGYFAAGRTIDWLGRKKTLIISMVLTGFSLFAILIVKSSPGNGVLIFSCVFAAVSAGAWCALDVLSTERFPTMIRSTALAMLTVVGRISAILGTMIFGLLSGKDFLLPILLTGLAFMGGAYCCKLLPDTKLYAE
mmetsp:Transcript_3141/g.7574  ORF Transcript_3141/g.7574 Transcript_3141/m.7574 type:complete len:571 (+) Transcript_3141:28-1740(+)